MIAVINYDLGNLASVSKAVESLGAEVEVTSDKKKISHADGVILPGVGAFYHGIKNLENLGIIPIIKNSIKEGKPFLGICLGLQLLFTETEEHGIHKGLDIINGKVKRFKNNLKIPHMGWNQIKRKPQNAKCRIFEGIEDGAYFYFVHSYYVNPEDENITAAATDYGIEFSSAVVKDNVWGVQFHPEKSGKLGLIILKNFLSLCWQNVSYPA